jgi:hypothetical protein
MEMFFIIKEKNLKIICIRRGGRWKQCVFES